MGTDWPAGRIVHLNGGCRAINLFDPQVLLEPTELTGRTISINLEQYGSIYAVLEQMGFKIIGVEYIHSRLELDGRVPPEWRPYCRINKTAWEPFECQQAWRNISHEAFKYKNAYIHDLASRISYQLNTCYWRLQEISASYNHQLAARMKSGKFEPGQFFMDGYTVFVYMALQTFLVDTCILRDYFSEFINGFICNNIWKLEPARVPIMSQLKKHVFDKNDIQDELFQFLKNSTNEGGWLEILGCYRDLVVHSAPLAQAEKRLFVESGIIQINESTMMPQIRCAIPSNPSEIREARAQGIQFENFEKWIELVAKIAKGETDTLDGLEYALSAIKNMVEMANLIAKLSPIEPKMMHLNSSDIIGPIEII